MSQPDFMALLREVSHNALDNMEGENLDGFKNWERVYVLSRELYAAIKTAETPHATTIEGGRE